jgi:hypothetical protein
MAKTRVLPAGSAEKPNLPVTHSPLSTTVVVIFISHLVIQLWFKPSLNFSIALNKTLSAITAQASRCALLTAGPLGPLDKVVNTLGS